MIHEISPALSNVYHPFPPRPEDTAMCFDDERLLCREKDCALTFPQVADVQTVGPYLFSIGQTRFFAAAAQPFGDYLYRAGQELRGAAPQTAAFAAMTALHLCRWYRDHRFCGRCGAPMRHDEKERAMRCACGNLVYPVICPAVIVAVELDGAILLTKYNRPNARWALVAGYTEIGETPEETVRREVMEETGLRVREIRYYKSQPWGLSGSLLAGFFCKAEPGELRVDGEELGEGRWFRPEEIDFPDDGVSLTREMIEVFRRGGAQGAPYQRRV